RPVPSSGRRLGTSVDLFGGDVRRDGGRPRGRHLEETPHRRPEERSELVGALPGSGPVPHRRHGRAPAPNGPLDLVHPLQGGAVALRIRSGRPVQPKISAGVLVRATGRARAGKPIRATVSLPQLSVVHLALQADSGEVALTPDRTYGPGSARLKGHLPPLASG